RVDEVPDVTLAVRPDPPVVDVPDVEQPSANPAGAVHSVLDGLHCELDLAEEGGPDPGARDRGRELDRVSGHAFVRSAAVTAACALVLAGQGGRGAHLPGGRRGRRRDGARGEGAGWVRRAVPLPVVLRNDPDSVPGGHDLI